MLRWTRKTLAIMVIIFRQHVNTRYVRNSSAFTQYDCLWKKFFHSYIGISTWFHRHVFEYIVRKMLNEISNWFKNATNHSSVNICFHMQIMMNSQWAVLKRENITIHYVVSTIVFTQLHYAPIQLWNQIELYRIKWILIEQVLFAVYQYPFWKQCTVNYIFLNGTEINKYFVIYIHVFKYSSGLPLQNNLKR